MTQRPHITVDELKVWHARCHEKPCTWHCESLSRPIVYEQVDRHRDEHRRAVAPTVAATTETEQS